MRGTRLLLVLAGLAGCATIADSGDKPSRQSMAAALLEWMHCGDPAGATDCAPTEIIMQSLRCRTPDDPGHAAQRLCHFSYILVESRTSRLPLGPDCAYLSRGAQGAWRIDSYPDADVCDER